MSVCAFDIYVVGNDMWGITWCCVYIQVKHTTVLHRLSLLMIRYNMHMCKNEKVILTPGTSISATPSLVIAAPL